LSEEIMNRVASADLAVLATLDDHGHPWAWPLAGDPGMIRPLGPTLLRVLPPVAPPLELVWQISQSSAIGLVSVDLAQRVRARVSGQAAMAGPRLAISVDEAFANGSRFVHTRAGRQSPTWWPEVRGAGRELSPEHAEVIRRSDTFFIATRTARGRLDASHRGGAPGFVGVLSPTALEFRDHAGHGRSRTIDNLAGDERAGLLFVDFEAGSWIQLMVKAVADPSRGVGVRCRVIGVVEGTGLSRRWTLLERSPDVL
jgi:predicted pyridoxine 5'-phosphate oxidase superfamily flavin-nucleotide-binding protein